MQNIEELGVEERQSILNAMRKQYRVQLEQLRFNMELATFLKETQDRLDAIRKDSEQVIKVIQWLDEKIKSLSS